MSQVKIGHASWGESGGYNQQAGDQTGNEVYITDWYSKPWQFVLRCTDPDKAEAMAAFMERCCANDNIGYDMGDRLTLYNQLIKNNWIVENVEPCECDCSALVAVCCQAAGLNVYQSAVTSNLRRCCMNTGYFVTYDSAEYINDYKLLKRGDILLTEGEHVAMVVAGYEPEEYTLKYRTTTALNMRSGPGSTYSVVTVIPGGAEVLLASDEEDWCKTKYNEFTGYCSKKYLSK